MDHLLSVLNLRFFFSFQLFPSSINVRWMEEIKVTSADIFSLFSVVSSFLSLS